jgi:hypothetical protein
MKLVKLSLCTMLAVGALVSSVQANEFSDAMSNGKFKGQLKADYYTNTSGTTSQSSILMMALRLNYVTGDFYGFSAGASSQTATAPGSNSSESATAHGGNVIGFGEYSEGTVLSESYLAYKLNKTSFKLGRQYMRMPLAKSAVSRIIKTSYSGATFTDKSLPDTTIEGAYITMMQSMTDGKGSTDIADFEALDSDNNHAYVVSALNKSIKDLSLMGAYGEFQHNYKLYQGEAKYNIQLGSLKYNAAVKHTQTDYETSAKGDPYFTTAKVGADMKGFGAFLAYTDVNTKSGSDAHQAKHGIVDGATKLEALYTSTYIYASELHDSTQKAIALYYKRPGVVVQLRYTDTDMDFDGTDYNTKMFRGVYKFTKEFIGACLYEMSDYTDNDKDKEELRLRLTYLF